eukprot:ctg_1387.g443
MQDANCDHWSRIFGGWKALGFVLGGAPRWRRWGAPANTNLRTLHDHPVAPRSARRIFRAPALRESPFARFSSPRMSLSAEPLDAADAGLPHVYDEEAITAYWSARPAEVARRLVEITSTLVPFVVSVAAASAWPGAGADE